MPSSSKKPDTFLDSLMSFVNKINLLENDLRELETIDPGRNGSIVNRALEKIEPIKKDAEEAIKQRKSERRIANLGEDIDK